MRKRSLRKSTKRMEVLSDKDKKARYDQFGFAGVDPNFGGGAGGGNPYAGGAGSFDFTDIFDSFFGGGFGGGGRRNPNAPRRGSDVEASATLSFEEAAKGCKEKNVTYHQIENCPDCNGSGAAKGTKPQDLPELRAAPVRCASTSAHRSAWCSPQARATAATAEARLSIPRAKRATARVRSAARRRSRFPFRRVSMTIRFSECRRQGAMPVPTAVRTATCTYTLQFVRMPFYAPRQRRLVRYANHVHAGCTRRGSHGADARR